MKKFSPSRNPSPQSAARISFLSAIFIGVSLVLIPLSGIQAQCWNFQHSATSDYFRNLSFCDSLNGIGLGINGSLHRTSDGGRSWQRLPETNPFLNICLVDSTVGYYVGAFGLVRRTDDGGFSWRTLYPGIAAHFGSVAFRNRNTGFIGGGFYDTTRAVILKTTDGGSSWTTVHLLTPTIPDDIQWLDSLTAVAAGDIIYRTSDGGETWHALGGGGFGFSSVSFCDANNGIAVAGFSLFTTHDGGITWKSRMNIDTLGWGLYSGAMADSSHIVLVGGRYPGWDEGRVMTSSDDGASWSVRRTPSVLMSVAFPTPRYGIIGGINGTILTSSAEDCSPPSVISPTPPDRYGTAGLFPNGRRTLSWDCPLNLTLTSVHLQLSPDSLFSRDIIGDTIIPINSWHLTNSWTTGPLTKRTTYYWRLRWTLVDSSQTDWTEPWRFTTAGSVIMGSVFQDMNSDAVREPGEPAIEGLTVLCTGKESRSTTTDSSGLFWFGILDSGQYVIQVIPAAGYTFVSPPNGIDAGPIGYNDTLELLPFAVHFPWNSIAGTVFEDKNENGRREAGEPGLPDFVVTITGDKSDSCVTDSAGYFIFPRISPTQQFDTISLRLRGGWEQINPYQPSVYTLYIASSELHLTGFDFSLRLPPHDRIKIGLNFTDNLGISHQELQWGMRVSATHGIWGIDPAASVIDFAEGEFELPPISGGFFDARFIGQASTFGSGSWIDMRAWTSASQLDTFMLMFSPGIIEGGAYPVKFTWSSSDIASYFFGPVTLTDRYNNITDMKSAESLVISDSTVYRLKLMSAGPVTSPQLLPRWRMLSLPGLPPSGAGPSLASKIFFNAFSSPFVYQGNRYRIPDSMGVGNGFWLRCSGTRDTAAVLELSLRSSDTITLLKGWNLIGALGLPLDTRNTGQVSTVPDSVITSRFFGYTNSYTAVDTLQPFNGYWVKARMNGLLVLNQEGHSIQAGKESVRFNRFEGLIITITDAAGNRQRLYAAPVETAGTDSSTYELPPLPPAGSFDSRFGGNRWQIPLASTGAAGIPILMQSAEYPAEIAWEWQNTNPQSVQLCIRDTKGEHMVSLSEFRGSTSLPSEPQTILVRRSVSRNPLQPVRTELYQNHPNPFNPVTEVEFVISSAALVRHDSPSGVGGSFVAIHVYDILGREVATLVNEVMEAGEHRVRWDASGMPSGVYYCRMTAEGYVGVRKMMLLR
jgi:photosystem II stability/assembly factor-like uncharacterized protein